MAIKKITFGDGATLKIESNVQRKNNGTLVPMSTRPLGGKFWFDIDNFSKWCVEGAVSNLLCQLLLTTDAENLKICNGEELILQRMGIQFQKLFYLKQDKSMLWKSACGY